MKNIFKSIFQNKRVFVTGHTGFKGTWLTLWLKELGAEITGYSLEPNTTPSMFNELNLARDINHIIGDIRDEEKLKKAFDESKPEIVFHLAAQPIVRLSYSEPKYTFEVNTIGTINVFEAARACGSVKVIVNVTSDKCYENQEWIYSYREHEPMGGYDPYSASKGCSELITASYRKSFFNPKDYGTEHTVALASGRAGNVIGGGDWASDRLVPDCARFLSKGEDIIIRSPKSIRPWQHVLEPLAGYLWLAALLYTDGATHADGWNFGPLESDVKTVEEVVSTFIEAWGSGTFIAQTNNILHEAKLLKLDISKAQYKLNWKPVYDVYEAISETVAWYKHFYEKAAVPLYEFTRMQIQSYIQKAEQLDVSWVK